MPGTWADRSKRETFGIAATDRDFGLFSTDLLFKKPWMVMINPVMTALSHLRFPNAIWRKPVWLMALIVAGLSAAAMSAQEKDDPGATFVNVAREAGITAKTIYGGERKNRYQIENTGCGVAIFDYDNDGWLDLFLVNGTRLEGVPVNPAEGAPTNHLYRNNGNYTFTDVTVKAGLEKTGWGQGVCVGD